MPLRTAASDVTSNKLLRAAPRHTECLSCVYSYSSKIVIIIIIIIVIVVACQFHSPK